jgi:transcriptional regulator of acetoin/glycerol metabolism
MDPAASTYSAAATSHVQSMCTYHVLGCTDVNAFNYVAAATLGISRKTLWEKCRRHGLRTLE